MQRELVWMKKMILVVVLLSGIPLFSHGQLSLTIEKALDIAEENSPTLRRSHMNLDRYQETLIAQMCIRYRTYTLHSLTSQKKKVSKTLQLLSE